MARRCVFMTDISSNEPEAAGTGASADTRDTRQQAAGRLAADPRKLPLAGWKHVIGRVIRDFIADRVMLFSAGVTLYMLLALVPALSVVVSIYGLFSDPASIPEQMAIISGIIPQEGFELISDQLERIAQQDNSSLGWGAILALAVALWGASLGIKGLFEAMNIAYGEAEKRSLLHIYALSLVLAFGAAVTAVAALVAVVFLPAVIALFALQSLAEIALSALSFVVFGSLLLFSFAVLYRWGPSRKNAKWRWITPGAVFAIVAILAISIPFSWYVRNFGNYSATYGSLGAIIAFLTWVWLSIIAVVLGAKLNAEIEHQTAIDTTVPPDKPMGERGAYVADTLGD